jgi:hypothetical protein
LVSTARNKCENEAGEKYKAKYSFQTHVKLLNSPKEKSLSIFACPHALSRFLSQNRVPSVHMAQKKHLQVNLVLQ